MSETTATALKFAAGIILAIVLVSIAINVFTPASESAKAVTQDFSLNTAELKEQKFLLYDNTVVNGSQVISALRKFESQGLAQEIAIQVKTGKNAAGTWYYSTFDNTNVTASGVKNLENAVDYTHIDYINPSGLFDATVSRDTNGVIRGITFVQQTRQ